jgi:parvulin-like peptidyl-prolyl isomerase
MRYRSLFAVAAVCATLTACEGLKEALTAHVDVAARAGSQELSVTRLADLVGHAKLQVPANREVAGLVADLWVDYQLLGVAAAHGDSLNDRKSIDEATQSYSVNLRLRHLQDTLLATLAKDTASEAGYTAGKNDLYDARHILFQFPVGATQAQKDSVRKKAEGILGQVTDKNFADMAKKYSSDGSAVDGGKLGVFPRKAMVPEFGNAVAALKPGEISKLVQTQFGYHIIQRLSWDEAKAEYTRQYPQLTGDNALRGYLAKVDSSAAYDVKKGAAQAAKVAAIDPGTHRKDNTTLVTYKGGELTVDKFLTWLDGMPAQQRIPQQMQTAPDSIINGFLKNIARNQILLDKADSMKIQLTQQEQDNMYHDFAQLVSSLEQALGVDAKLLADSAKTEPERERLAAAHVEAYMDAVMAARAQPIPVPTPLKVLLESKYDWKVNAAGLDRATERARSIRATEDSTRAANQPKSQVPLPGIGQPGAAGAPPSAVPTPAPAPASKPAAPPVKKP